MRDRGDGNASGGHSRVTYCCVVLTAPNRACPAPALHATPAVRLDNQTSTYETPRHFALRRPPPNVDCITRGFLGRGSALPWGGGTAAEPRRRFPRGPRNGRRDQRCTMARMYGAWVSVLPLRFDSGVYGVPFCLDVCKVMTACEALGGGG